MQYNLTSSFALAFLLAAGNTLALPQQSAYSYAVAIRDHSTAPSYVRASIVNDQTGGRQERCYPAPRLLEAIKIEHDLAATGDAPAQSRQLALRNPQREFHFRKQSALDQLRDTFSDADLAQVRTRLAAFSNAQLVLGFSSAGGELHAIYSVQPRPRYQALRDAVICVLLERGFSAGHGDYADLVWLRDDNTDPDKAGNWLPERQ